MMSMIKNNTYYLHDCRVTKFITNPEETIIENIDNSIAFEKLKQFFSINKDDLIINKIRSFLLEDRKNLKILSSILQLNEKDVISWIVKTFPTEIDNKLKFCLKHCYQDIKLKK